MTARFEYVQVYAFTDVQAYAAAGWRVAAVAVVPGRHPGESASALYVLERAVAEDGAQ